MTLKIVIYVYEGGGGGGGGGGEEGKAVRKNNLRISIK